jgi:hypothetical protein
MTLALVNLTTGSWTDAIGPQSVSPGNTAGNLLVAAVSLIAPSTLPGAAQIVPAASVCDSAGNWWRLAADTGGSTAVPLRITIWVCGNALAIPSNGWLSVSAAGYTSGLECVIAEFSGLPAGYEPVIDFTIPYENYAAGSVSFSAVALQADYCFTATRILAGTLTPPSSPWIFAGAATATALSYAAFSNGAGITASSSVSPSGPAAGVIIGISQASYPPSNGNPNFPVVRLEAAFGAFPGDSSQSVLDNAWTDITERAISGDGVAGITVSRGRQYELATPEAGELTALLNNVDGAFNPASPSSPYYSNALNQNMSFQSGTAPWTSYDGASLSQSSAFTFASTEVAVQSAQYSMLLSPDGVTAAPYTLSENISVNQNNPSYTASFWVYCPAGWAAGVYVGTLWYTSSFGFISEVNGSTVVMPAGQWTLVQCTASPPATAAYVQFGLAVNGTPASSVLFYLAEGAIALGSSVQTGLVRLQTPVRVSASWQGQRYPVGYGYVERWPQSWPQMPQWGFSPMVATDVVGIANAVNLPSAVQGEVLADQPYVCFPFNEQYQTSSSTINGVVAAASNASGLIAINTSRVNQQAANYISGDEPIETGQTMGFNGDSGTGMGVTSYSDIVTTNSRGSGVVYGPDTGLPVIGQATGLLVDAWFTVPTVTNTTGSAQLLPVIQLFGKPYIGSIGAAALAPGWLATVGAYLPASGTTASVYIQYSQSGSIGVISGAIVLGGLYYAVIDVQPSGDFSVTINGSSTFTGSALLAGPLETVTFGQANYAYGSASSRWNYSLAYGSVYSYEVPEFRYTSHYTAGSTGFSGDSVIKRAGRYCAWAQLGASLAGPGAITDAFQLSAAYSTDGASLASALNADAQSAGSAWFGNANGNLVILPRPATYRQSTSIVFGDNAAFVLNPGPDFSMNGAGWAAAAATLAIVTTQPAGALYPFAGLMTLTSSTGFIAETGGVFPAVAGASYTVGCWAYTNSSTMFLGFTWVNNVSFGTTVTSSSIPVQPNTWTYVSFTSTAIAGTVNAVVIAGLTGSTGNYAYIEHITAIIANGEIPYEGDLGLDYDNTYIQNVTQATLTQGPNSLIAPVEKNQLSISQYLTRGPQAVTVNGTSAQDAYDVSYWYLNKYQQPQLRVSQVTIGAATNPLSFTLMLQTDLSDVAVLNRRPLGAPAYSLPVITQRTATSIGPGVWDVTLQLSPYIQEGNVLTADVTGENVLGSSTLAW